MFKILILAYLIGQDPVDTQKTFKLDNNFETMEKCKQELFLIVHMQLYLENLEILCLQNI